MYDFRDIRACSKEEQIRAWSVEKAVEATQEMGVFRDDLIATSKAIEDFILKGKESTDG